MEVSHITDQWKQPNVEVLNSNLNIRNQVAEEITNGFILKCPKFIDKSCSSGAGIVKSAGCNHMQCPVCHVDFCFICGVDIGSFDKKWQSPQHGCMQSGTDDLQICKGKARGNVAILAQRNGWTDQQLLEFAKDLLKDIDWPTA